MQHHIFSGGFAIADIVSGFRGGVSGIFRAAAPANKVSAFRVGYRHYRFHLPRFVSRLLHRRSAGLTIESDGNHRLLPPTPAFSVFRGAAPHWAQAHTAPLSASTATAQSSPHPRQTYLFTCSPDECEVMPGHRRRRLLLHRREAFRLSSLRLVPFCLFRIWGI